MPFHSQASCSHDHDCKAMDCGPSFSLYKHIDLPRVRCLNEREPGSCRHIFGPWEMRLATNPAPLRSNVGDTELLIHVPFDGAVKLKAIAVVGGTEGTAPSNLKVFVNRDDIDFSLAEQLPPVQEWDLLDGSHGVLEYPTQVAKFNGVHSLDMLISGNFGADHSAIHFIGLKGDFTERKREAVSALYEARPVPSDHQVPGGEQRPHHQLS